MHIHPFVPAAAARHERLAGEMAALLVAAFAHMPSAWKTAAEAREEVAALAAEADRLAWVAVEDRSPDAALLGWIGAIRQSAHAWELHPLVVAPGRQRQGVGRALVATLEAAAREAGVATVWLGTDDDYGGTTLFGHDLYPDPLARLAGIAPEAASPYPHPYQFYQRLGYAVVGVLPDADGPGRHDILMAKRVGGGGASPPPAAG